MENQEELLSKRMSRVTSARRNQLHSTLDNRGTVTHLQETFGALEEQEYYSAVEEQQT